jgi:hypothetical protein
MMAGTAGANRFVKLRRLSDHLTELIVGLSSRPGSFKTVVTPAANAGARERTVRTRGELKGATMPAIVFQQVRYVAGLTATDHHLDSIVESLASQGALATFRRKNEEREGVTSDTRAED